NPPYGADIDKLVPIFKKIYPETTKSFTEIYKIFFDKGIELLNKKGILAYITPNTYLLQPRYKDLRKFLLQYKLNIIINLGENVFDNAVVSTAIIILEKKQESSKIKIADLSANSRFLGSLDKVVFSEIVQVTFYDTESNIFVTNIRKKAENEYSLGEIMELKDAGFKYQRKNVGLSKKGNNNLAERIFYEGSIENKEDIPILIGKDINAYYHSDAPNKKLRKEYKNLLKDNESTYYNKEIMDSREKLIWRQTAPYFIGTILRDKNYFGNTIQAGIIKDSFVNKISYEYLCGLLNSKYLRYLYENNVREIGKTFPQVKLEKLRPLPIIISENQSFIFDLVNEAVKTKRDNPKADITNIENQIDILVYKLYNLTYEEVKVIDPNIESIISKEEYETKK
ncbi:Eco57I restriction-modification methylase domain-containing protein, partial [Capnocytophaga genosp. AHN8471]|uniref:Eco57I restriction-modification methylase domain-containing protein n=1 Tax=Capnocytophaga genosp. AHN8471 TaxID=327574 RepID=UPI001932E761